MKHTKKISKKLGILLIGICLIVGAGVSTLMSWYVDQESNVDAGEVLMWDSVNAEDLEVCENITDGVGGNTYSYEHWLNYSTDTQEDLVVKFTITNSGVDDPEGIYFTLYTWNGTAWIELTDEIEGTDTFTMTAGGLDLKMKTEYVFDTYLEEGDYQYTLMIERNV